MAGQLPLGGSVRRWKHGRKVTGEVNKDTAPGHISWAEEKGKQRHDEEQPTSPAVTAHVKEETADMLLSSSASSWPLGTFTWSLHKWVYSSQPHVCSKREKSIPSGQLSNKIITHCICFILRPFLALGTQSRECFDTRCNPLTGSKTLLWEGAGSVCGGNVLEYSLQNPQTCPRIRRTLTTDPNTGEILSPHLPPPVNMKMLCLKGWRKHPTRGPGRMRAEEGLLWERSPATTTLFSHWKKFPLVTTKHGHFLLVWKNNRLGLFFPG